MQNPHQSHWKAVKRTLRYVRGTFHLGIHYSVEASPLLVGFTDFDWGDDPDDRSLLQVMSSFLVLDLLHWLARNKVPFLFLEQKQSIVVS